MIAIRPTRGRDGRWGEIVPVPEHNEYGRFRLYQRTDGMFVVFDPHDPLELVAAARPISSEAGARAWAEALARGRTCARCHDPLMPEEDDRACAACVAYGEQRGAAE